MFSLCFVPAILFLTGDHRFVPKVSSSALLETSGGTTFEVCLSPGCVADGAKEALEKMQALAAPFVKAGVCCSLCGNGPIVLDQSNNKKYRKVTTDEKLVEILFGEEGMNSQQNAILDGVNLVFQADDVLKNNPQDYEKAIGLYEKGIEMGLKPSLELTKVNNEENPSADGSMASCLQWLISARQNEAIAKLKVGDSDGALLAAQNACELSQNTSPAAFEVLQEVYGSLNDAAGELQALRALFDLAAPGKLTAMQENKRRTLGFRLAKLERECK